MTEADWLTATDPRPMLEFLRGKASDRKLRLFAVACCRLVWDSLTHTRSRQAVDAAEQYADGVVDDATLERARSMAFDALARYQYVNFRARVLVNRDRTLPELRLTLAADSAHAHKPFLIGRLQRICYDPDIAVAAPIFLRDIFNPFRPVVFDPAWRSETVFALASGIYADRAFDRLPILADALEEAGCDQPDILNHCRGPGPHVRGCWAVDLVLGKS